MPGVPIRENTVRYSALTSELIFSWFKEECKEQIFYPALEIGHKDMFFMNLMETIINVFSRHI